MTAIRSEMRWIAALLIVTVAMGMLDAVSLLHFHTFTGYMTGTVILLGVGVVRGQFVTLTSLSALGAFLIGGLLGGRWVRRKHPSQRLVGQLLGAAALLVCFAAALSGTEANLLAVVAPLGLAMGLQTSGTRFAGVADMTMPAATMILHGLAHDSPLAGGAGQRMPRRIGVLLGLIVGAAAGAGFAQWHVWFALAVVGLLLAGAGVVLRPWESG
ncbi:YoaK family protein [Methylovirgula sp. 4M-Z18]|uniref:YoaK family protein n=1 Tax=Methylovirgula sp. 4M-Z18 TaxID=2293567 RepID=UPI000E2F8C14|nr:YoaK family protein [Methylovirgula sp. 4M-Z18]RFB80454.1 DUF1275 domain-containing protein [Methylovirgula sp. 4M-Z18]